MSWQNYVCSVQCLCKSSIVFDNELVFICFPSHTFAFLPLYNEEKSKNMENIYYLTANIQHSLWPTSVDYLFPDEKYHKNGGSIISYSHYNYIILKKIPTYSYLSCNKCKSYPSILFTHSARLLGSLDYGKNTKNSLWPTSFDY